MNQSFGFYAFVSTLAASALPVQGWAANAA